MVSSCPGGGSFSRLHELRDGLLHLGVAPTRDPEVRAAELDHPERSVQPGQAAQRAVGPGYVGAQKIVGGIVDEIVVFFRTHPLLFHVLEAGRLRNPVTGPTEELVVERVEDRPGTARGDSRAHHGIRFETVGVSHPGLSGFLLIVHHVVRAESCPVGRVELVEGGHRYAIGRLLEEDGVPQSGRAGLVGGLGLRTDERQPRACEDLKALLSLRLGGQIGPRALGIHVFSFVRVLQFEYPALRARHGARAPGPAASPPAPASVRRDRPQGAGRSRRTRLVDGVDQLELGALHLELHHVAFDALRRVVRCEVDDAFK